MELNASRATEVGHIIKGTENKVSLLISFKLVPGVEMLSALRALGW